jgi:AraC family transcriptional regulator
MRSTSCSVSIGMRFRSYLPKERIKNLWETEDGLAFIQRQRDEAGPWEGAGSEPLGLYHVIIHLEDCEVTTTHNGRVRYTGHRPPNAVQFSRPDEEVNCTGKGSFKFLTVSFAPEFLAGHFETLLINADLVELRDVPSNDDLGLACLARAYDSSSASGMPLTQLYFDILRQAMLDRIVLRHATCPIRRGPSEILVRAKARRVIDYIEAHLASDLHLVELSAVAGTSRSHFARAFRNTIGMAPHAFVLQRRLARAHELLRSGRAPIREVAERCGFSDQAHLTRAFKSRFGSPPSVHAVPVSV